MSSGNAESEHPATTVEVVKPEDDEIPSLENVEDINAAMESAAAQHTAGKQSKRYTKTMAKLGAKPEPNILRVTIKGPKLSFFLSNPETYRFTGSNTFVCFGQIQMDESQFNMQQAAARAVTGEEEAQVKPVAAEEPKEEVSEDIGDLDVKEIEMVMAQAKVSRADAIKAMKNNNGDLVNAIMELTS